MAKNINSFQQLRNAEVFDNLAAAKVGLTNASTQDGVIKLARYYADGEKTIVKTIFGVNYVADGANDPDKVGKDYTIFEADANVEEIADIKAVVEALNGDDTVDGSVKKQLKDAINALDMTEVAVAGKPIVSVSQADGVVAAAAGEISAEFVTVSATGLTSTTVDAAIAEVNAAYKAADEAIVGDASESANTLGKLEKLISTVEDEEKTYEIAAVTGDALAALGENVKEAYKLVETGTDVAVGEVIKVYKDSTLKSASFEGQDLTLTYILSDGSETAVTIDMSSIVLESEVENGIQAVGGKLSVKLDESGEGFLTVGADGLKLSGVQDAIDEAVSGASADVAELSGKTVTEIASANGSIVATSAKTDGTVKYDIVTDASKVKMAGFTAATDGLTDVTTASSVTDAVKAVEGKIKAIDAVSAAKVDVISVNGVTSKAAAEGDVVATVTIDGADIKLDGYAKGTNSGDIAATDTVNAALGKLENKVANAVANSLVGVEAGNGVNVTAVADNKQTISAVAATNSATGIANPITVDGQGIKFATYLDAGTY